MDYPDTGNGTRAPEASETLKPERVVPDLEPTASRKLNIIKHGERDHLFIDLHIFFSVIGFGSFFAWGCLVFYSLMVSTDIPAADTVLFMVLCMFSAVVALLFGWWFPRIYFKGTRLLGVVVAVAALATLIALYLPSYPGTFYLSCIAWCIVGVGIAALFGLWSDLVAVQKSGTLRAYIALSLLLAAAQALWVMLLRDEVLQLFVFLIPLVSLVICYFLRRSSFLSKRMAHMNKKEAATKMTISWQSMLNTVAIGAIIGFSLSWLLHIKVSAVVIIAISALSCLIDGVVLIDINTRKYFGENILMKVFPVTVLLGLLPMVFFDDTGRTLCAGFVCAIGPLFAIQGLGGCFEHIVLHRQSPPNTSGYGRLYSYLGICVGLLVGFAAFETGVFGENTSAIFIISIVVCAVVITLFAMAENRFPIDEKAEAELLFFQAEQILKENPDATPEDIDRELMKGKRVWKMRCDRVAQHYDLSSRQIEVFRLLAKGRNAEYITEELVISPHTTKAHIYSIYQKLGVHSRQELISLIEAMPLAPDPGSSSDNALSH
jgi:DNA-binding CsgD family transcriptional regulator